MNVAIPFSIIGISGSLFLGFLLVSKHSKGLTSKTFLGIFFFLLSFRLGKLLIQEYASDTILNINFNVMHATFLAIGPVIWFYILSYVSSFSFKVNKNGVHFLPALTLLFGAYYIRLAVGEKFWIVLYWMIQAHPILYLLKSIVFLQKSSSFKSRFEVNEKTWIYSLLIIVASIVIMNVLYFTVEFPFYLVTALLLILTVYLFTFLAFRNNGKIISGKRQTKYKNLNLNSEKTVRIKNKIDRVILEERLYLNDQIKLADISKELAIPSHVISSVINQSHQMNFSKYINLLRVKAAQQSLVNEQDKKIIAIALESGFHSLSAFNRAFKEHTQMNPSSYRAKFAKEKAPDL